MDRKDDAKDTEHVVATKLSAKALDAPGLSTVSSNIESANSVVPLD